MNVSRLGKATLVSATLFGFAVPSCMVLAKEPSATLLLDTSGAIRATATIYQESETCLGTESRVDIDQKRERKVSIRAGQPLSFGMASIDSETTQCHKVMTFTPLEGHRYLATYMQQATAGKCAVLLSDISHTSKISQISPTQRTYTPPLVKDGAACK